jgi:Putative adhesin
MSSLIRKLLVAAGLLVVVAGAALAIVNFGFDETKVTTHTIAEPVRAIVVKSASGNVDLVAARADVEVRETQHYVSTKPTLRQEVRNGVLTLDSACDAHFLRCYADLRISVPAGAEVTVDAESGNVEAHRIDVRDMHASSDSGNVRLELVGSQRSAWAHTDSGNVDVIAADAHVVDAKTDSGNVTVDAAGTTRRVIALTDSGNVAVAVPRGDYAVQTDTDSGDTNIDGIMLNDHAQKSIEAKTDSGNITLGSL